MSTERKTIFLVDDDITNLTVGRNALADFYNIFTMNSGSRMMKMLEKNIPDLILLDVNMPEMSGYEAIKTLKSAKETKDIPVIFLTAKNDSESELEGLSLGAIDYIIKPFSPVLLRKRIEIHLELINYTHNLVKMVEEKTRTVVELQNSFLRTMAELVEFRDDITGGHIVRTQLYMNALLNALIELGMYEEETSTWDKNFILQSAQLHDVGKIRIRDSILQKPGKLTDEEFAEIKQHALLGETVIEKIKSNTTEQSFLEHAKILASTHHEKWDGSGYPKGLKGNEIPLEGRLMAVADVYDALVSERSYKKAFTHEEAVKIITSGSGKHFDPNIVVLFVYCAEEFHEIAQSNKSG